MTEQKHTPGQTISEFPKHSPAPWSTNLSCIYDALGNAIGVAKNPGVPGDPVIPSKANAAMFAASPDMFAALEKATPALILLGNYIGNEWRGGGGIESFDRCGIIEEIRAAIAKAKE